MILAARRPPFVIMGMWSFQRPDPVITVPGECVAGWWD